jgi:hypothetical protein
MPRACSWRTGHPPQPWRIAHSRYPKLLKFGLYGGGWIKAGCVAGAPSALPLLAQEALRAWEPLAARVLRPVVTPAALPAPGPPERHVACNLVRVGPHESELSYRVSPDSAGCRARESSGNTTQEQAA